VADLNQAIGLLGIKPLKLLVLGFSLPDALFAEIAGRELRWYWTNTLTRAVAARMLSEQLWHRAPHEVGSGDEAFVASMLQDIGILVLMRELGSPYVKFLSGAIEEKCNLAALEHDTLGFDHAQLSAALLSRWQLPQRLVEAIATPKRQARLARLPAPEGDLPQILHLAELLMQLVGQQRLRVLPDLLDSGRVYRGMTKQALATLVEGLQPQVDQLAEVLLLELSEERDYVQTLLAAHEQMVSLTEDFAGRLHGETDEDQQHAQLLDHTRELSQAMHDFLRGGNPRGPAEVSTRQWAAQHAAHEPPGTTPSQVADTAQQGEVSLLVRNLVSAVNRCRERRRELSLLIVEPNVFDVHSDPYAEYAARQVRFMLVQACSHLEQENVTLVSIGDMRTAAILSGCDRRAAVGIAQSAVATMSKQITASEGTTCEVATTISVGVATASVISRNFDPVHMVECAERCLSAARACGISTVKSIEV
jgi:GGDEF domain-containing protein